MRRSIAQNPPTPPLNGLVAQAAHHLNIFYPNPITISTHGRPCWRPAHNRTASKRRTSRVDAHPLGPEHQAARFATDQQTLKSVFMQRTLSVQLNFSYLCWRSSWVFIVLRVLGFSPTSLALRIPSSTSRRSGVSVGTVVPSGNVASSIVSTGPVLGFTGFTSPVGFSTCAGPTSEAVPDPFDDASKA
ncbi:unnamed protein product [Prunus armeniaca]